MSIYIFFSCLHILFLKTSMESLRSCIRNVQIPYSRMSHLWALGSVCLPPSPLGPALGFLRLGTSPLRFLHIQKNNILLTLNSLSIRVCLKKWSRVCYPPESARLVFSSSCLDKLASSLALNLWMALQLLSSRNSGFRI